MGLSEALGLPSCYLYERILQIKSEGLLLEHPDLRNRICQHPSPNSPISIANNSTNSAPILLLFFPFDLEFE